MRKTYLTAMAARCTVGLRLEVVLVADLVPAWMQLECWVVGVINAERVTERHGEKLSTEELARASQC